METNDASLRVDVAALGLAMKHPRVQRLRAFSTKTAAFTRARLLELCGDVELPVTPTRGGRIVIDPRHGRPERPRSLSAQLDAMSRDSDAGYVIASLDALPARARRELAHPFADLASFQSGKLWVSTAGTVSDLHFDLAHNLFVQLAGEKRVTLARRRDSLFVGPRGPFASIPNGAAIDPEQPDYERFPLARWARFESFVLGPGDALVIPAGVWHHVRSLSESISVNFWWAVGVHAQLARLAGRVKRILEVST